MKRGTSSVWILLSLWSVAALAVGGTWWLTAEQTTAAAELAARIEEIELAVLAGDWEVAAKEIRLVLASWEQTRRTWALYTDHAEMDVVTDLLIEGEASIATKSTSAFAALRQARDRITTLPQRNRLDLENLF